MMFTLSTLLLIQNVLSDNVSETPEVQELGEVELKELNEMSEEDQTRFFTKMIAREIPDLNNVERFFVDQQIDQVISEKNFDEENEEASTQAAEEASTQAEEEASEEADEVETTEAEEEASEGKGRFLARLSTKLKVVSTAGKVARGVRPIVKKTHRGVESVLKKFSKTGKTLENAKEYMKDVEFKLNAASAAGHGADVLLLARKAAKKVSNYIR